VAGARVATRRHCSSTVPAAPEGFPTLLLIVGGLFCNF